MCQRCLRTVCHECQTPGAVGVVCPECMKQQKVSRTPAQKKADRRWGGGSVRVSPVRTGTPVTFGILAVTVIAYVANMVPNLEVQRALLFNPILLGEPWRLLTVVLTHGSFLHLALNMLSLWMIGRALEPLIGSGRFLALYLIATIGGNAAVSVYVMATLQAGGTVGSVVGASGAIFGLMGAFVLIARRLGSDVKGMLVLLAVNLMYGFFVSGISWQAHVGGLIAGAIVGLIYYSFRKHSQRIVQILLLVALTIVLIALTYMPYVTWVLPYR